VGTATPPLNLHASLPRFHAGRPAVRAVRWQGLALPAGRLERALLPNPCQGPSRRGGLGVRLATRRREPVAAVAPRPPGLAAPPRAPPWVWRSAARGAEKPRPVGETARLRPNELHPTLGRGARRETDRPAPWNGDRSPTEENRACRPVRGPGQPRGNSTEKSRGAAPPCPPEAGVLPHCAGVPPGANVPLPLTQSQPRERGGTAFLGLVEGSGKNAPARFSPRNNRTVREAGRHVFSRKAFGRGEGGSFFSPAFPGLSGFRGVCRGSVALSLCRFRSGRFRRAAFGPLSGGPVGRFRPGAVVPPLPAVAVRVGRGRPVLGPARRAAVRPLLGSSLAAAPRFLRGAPGSRWFRGVGSGLPLRSALPLRLARPAGRPRRRRAARPGRLGWPLFLWPCSPPGWHPAARPGRPGRAAPACCWWRVPRGWQPSTAAAAPGCSAWPPLAGGGALRRRACCLPCVAAPRSAAWRFLPFSVALRARRFSVARAGFFSWRFLAIAKPEFHSGT
jgi:hypothetical protein